MKAPNTISMQNFTLTAQPAGHVSAAQHKLMLLTLINSDNNVVIYPQSCKLTGRITYGEYAKHIARRSCVIVYNTDPHSEHRFPAPSSKLCQI